MLSVLVKSSNGRPLHDVLDSLADDELRREIVDAAREIFGAIPVGAPTTAGNQSDPGLVDDLSDALSNPVVIAELKVAAEALWRDPDPDWLPWIQERYATTLAAAVIDAIQSSCPEVDASDLRCDIDLDGDPGFGIVRISEDQPGGVGVIEALVDRYVEDPRAFWALVTATLGPSDSERIDTNLRHYLAMSDDPSIAGPATRIRTTTDLGDLTDAWRDLRIALFQLGLDGDQSVIAALATRLLRPGSNRQLESLVSQLLKDWDALEASLGVEVELRVFAHVAASNPEMRRQLRTAVGGQATQAGWEIGQIVGLLWPRGNRLRASALQTYSPYVECPPTERLLFEEFIRPSGVVVDSSEAGWRSAVDTALQVDGSTTIRANGEAGASAVIRELLTEPTSVGVLEFHPRVVGVTRSPAGLDLAVELREAQQ